MAAAAKAPLPDVSVMAPPLGPQKPFVWQSLPLDTATPLLSAQHEATPLNQQHTLLFPSLL